jgi:predicted permease
MRKLFRRIHFLLHRRQIEADLADEMAAHREMMTDGRRGAFGRDLALREDARDVWGWIWLDRLWQDLSYALRIFRRAPGFTLGAVTVLALGVGANVAEFHVLDAALLHRLTMDGADSIFRFYRNSKDRGAPSFPYAAIGHFQTNCTQCAFVVSERLGGAVLESDGDTRVTFVSGNYFPALKILPSWGRLLDARDAQPGAPAVAVLGYEYWRDHEGADPHVVNRIVHVNSKPVQIVGVTPYDFDGLQPHTTAVWLSASQRPLLIPGAPSLRDFSQPDQDLFARAKPGVSLASLEAELTSLTRQLAHREPSQFKTGERILGERLAGSGVVPRRLKAPIFLLFALVLLVLLSACANLGNMLLARGMARQREIDIRIALGAGRGRVIRQLLTESLLLSAIGSAAGLLVGYLSARMLLSVLGAPPTIRVAMHWQILAGAAALTAFSAVAFGLPPALQITGAKHKSGRRRKILVGVQVAISSLLLICSGVLTRNAVRNAGTQLNFDYRNMIVAYPSFFGSRLPSALIAQKLDATMTRLGSLPGADRVTAAVTPPLGQRYSIDRLPGLPPVYTNCVAPNYFDAMGLPVLRGRAFHNGETGAAIVSETAARAIWPNEDPVGKSWQFENARRTVVGVVKDSGANLVVDSLSVEAYIPIEPSRVDQSAVIVHIKGDPSRFIRAVPAMSASMGGQVTVLSMAARREDTLDSGRKLISVLASLGLIATVLAAAGMFAMVAFAVAQRTREIGIRMAIGARPSDILRTLLYQNYAPIGFGMMAGTALGIGLGMVARSIIEIVDSPLDPPGFAAGLAAFLLIAALAVLSPALKALRIDPSSTLRYE